MICYMPFTYIDDQSIRKLTRALGPVSVYCPNPATIPDHMLAWVQKELLDSRCPQGIQADLLSKAIKEFKAWADLHQGNIADMAGFFKSQKGRPPMVDETSPTSIGDQIRKFGQPASREPDDPIFQAALFLAMAQEYDQQHAAVAQDLGAVMAMEQGMLSRLTGDAQDPEEGIRPAPAAGNSAGIFDPGAFMTTRRVQAWAELACRDIRPRPYILFVTPSPAVLEYLLDQFAQPPGPLKIDLGLAEDGTGESNPIVMESLNALAFAQDPADLPDDNCLDRHHGTNTAGLEIYTLAGLPPHRFPYQLIGGDSLIETPAPPSHGPVNTLIGLLER